MLHSILLKYCHITGVQKQVKSIKNVIVNFSLIDVVLHLMSLELTVAVK